MHKNSPKIPCPLVTADGQACHGHILGMAHRTEIRWNSNYRHAVGWSVHCVDPDLATRRKGPQFTLTCTVGRTPTGHGQLKLFYRDLPDNLKALVDESMGLWPKPILPGRAPLWAPGRALVR